MEMWRAILDLLITMYLTVRGGKAPRKIFWTHFGILGLDTFFPHFFHPSVVIFNAVFFMIFYFASFCIKLQQR